MWGRCWGLRSAILVVRRSDGKAVWFVVRHIHDRYRRSYRAGSMGAVCFRLGALSCDTNEYRNNSLVSFLSNGEHSPIPLRPALTASFKAAGAVPCSFIFPCILSQAEAMLSQAQFAQSVYSGRASTYDRTWHVRHASDFVKWGSMSPGQHVLDLATGTGLVALPAKQAVGPTGTVTGIDITDAMLGVAKKKARHENLDISFIRGDIMDLGALGLEEESYDVITGASCLPLLYDPGGAIKHWAGYLKVGGKLAVDVPTERSQLPSLVFEEVMADIGLGTPYGRRWVKGQESLEKLFIDTGLAIEQSLLADGYGTEIVFEAEQAKGLFDKLAGSAFGKALGDGEEREKAKKLFVDRLVQKAGWDGMVREEGGFYVVIGKRQ